MKAFAIALLLALAFLVGCKDKTQAPADAPKTTEAPQGQATEQAPEMSEMEQISYSMGLRIAPTLYEVYGALDPEWFAKGYRDAVAGNATLISDDEGAQLMSAREVEVQEGKRKLAKIIGEKAQELAQRYQEEVDSFLNDFKKQEGVVVQDSGLMYKVLEEGKGESPAAYDEVTLHFEGRLVNGTVFDSTYNRDRPVSLIVQGTFPGMIEALQAMHIGDRWEVVFPPDLAYGERGVGPVPPDSALVFDLKLLDINHPAEGETAQPEVNGTQTSTVETSS